MLALEFTPLCSEVSLNAETAIFVTRYNDVQWQFKTWNAGEGIDGGNGGGGKQVVL